MIKSLLNRHLFLINFTFGSPIGNSKKAQLWSRKILITLKKAALAANIDDDLTTVPVVFRKGNWYAFCKKCDKYLNVQRGKKNQLQVGNFLLHFFSQHHNFKPPYPKCDNKTFALNYPKLAKFSKL